MAHERSIADIALWLDQYALALPDDEVSEFNKERLHEAAARMRAETITLTAERDEARARADGDTGAMQRHYTYADDSCRCLACRYSNVLDERDELKAHLAEMTGFRDYHYKKWQDACGRAIEAESHLAALKEATRRLLDSGHHGHCPAWMAEDLPCLCGHRTLVKAWGSIER